VCSLRKVGLMQSMAVELSSLSDTFRPGCCMAGRARSIRLSMTFRFGKIVCNYAHGQMARSHFPRTSHLGGVAPAVLGRGHFPRSRRKSGPPCAPSRRSASHAPSALFEFTKQDPSYRGRKRWRRTVMITAWSVWRKTTASSVWGSIIAWPAPMPESEWKNAF